jgi:hypothetical protein
MVTHSSKVVSGLGALLHASILSQVLGPQVGLGALEGRRFPETSERNPTSRRRDCSIFPLTGDGSVGSISGLERVDVVLRSVGASGLGTGSPLKSHKPII